MGIGFATKQGGGLFRGPLVVTTCRALVGKPEGSTMQAMTYVVLRGRDRAGEKQEVWLGVGDKPGKPARFKPAAGGKDLDAVHKGDLPSNSSKWGIFARSLGSEPFQVGKQTVEPVRFPQSRLAQMSLAALDGCTLELDTVVMDVGPQILLDRQRQGKSAEPPVAYVVTAFELPGKGESSEDGEDGEDEGDTASDDDDSLLDSDDDGGSDADAELQKIVLAALKKVAGKPVTIEQIKKHLATKHEDNPNVDKWVLSLDPKSWQTTVASWGVVVDKKAKTLMLEE